MTRNGLYGLVGALIALVAVLGAYLIYQEQTNPRLEIKLDGSGIEVNGNG
jgi:hypothetical protein